MSGEWFARNTHAWSEWGLEELVAAKARTGERVSLVVPARNEAATVGAVVSRVREALVETVALVDEVVVVDSDSTDATYDVAADAGAQVHRAADIRPDLGVATGKGEAMWKSLFVTTGELLVFMDADLVDWDTHFVPGLLGPLLTRPEVALVKGFYERPLLPSTGSGSDPRGSGSPSTGSGSDSRDSEGGARGPGGEAPEAEFEGGRVTELVARPLVALLQPELRGLVQPLAGEWAVRRRLFESLSVPCGYAVELAALVDTAAAHGLDAIAQVGLGTRAHRHQSLLDLGAMATQIQAAVLRRRGVWGPDDSVALRQFADQAATPRPNERVVDTAERPPYLSVVGS